MAIKVIHNHVDRPNGSKLKIEAFSKPKVLVILGPTGSGKTRLGVELAREFGGEIISADSRQVYKGLDVGSGKDLAEYKVGNKIIPCHLIDVADPKKGFDLAQYQELAFRAIAGVIKRGHLPIIVGGSGLYLQALVDNYSLDQVRAQSPRRAQWEKWSASRLFQELSRLKPEFAARLNNSDKNNPRRLARYLEIAEAGDLDKVKKRESSYDFLLLGLSWPDDVLRKRIEFRILERLEKEGMIAEVERLNKGGLSWERLQSFGLEYKFISQHLLGELAYSEMIEKLSLASYRFAKRQKTWFKRWEKQGAKISWVKDAACAEKIIKKWL
jgi:tRNA dimethylallyltransferase